VAALVVAFAVVFLAEMGDKSQLVALSLASRFSPWVTLSAVTVAAMALHGLAATIGGAIAQAVSPTTRSVIAGILFILFGAWTLLRSRHATGNDNRDATEALRVTPRHSAFAAIAIAFFLSEFGDKTQLAVATLATTRNAFFTWLGAVVGMVAADGIAIGAGAGLRRVLEPHVVAWIAAAGFTVTGIVLLVSA
jgi:putative Ca2+/H+ antiporter (TMEM165/GDT1 family)